MRGVAGRAGDRLRKRVVGFKFRRALCCRHAQEGVQ